MSSPDPYQPPATEVAGASGPSRFKVGTFWGLVMASPLLLFFLIMAFVEVQHLIHRRWGKLPLGAEILGVTLTLILVVLGNSWCWACLFRITRKRHFLKYALSLGAIHSVALTITFMVLSRAREERPDIWMGVAGTLFVIFWIGGSLLSLGQGAFIHWQLRILGLARMDG